MSTKSLDRAIARTRSLLRFVPSTWARQAVVLSRLRGETDSFICAVHLHDPIARFIAGAIWPLPLPTPKFVQAFMECDPTYAFLSVMNEMHDDLWDAPPDKAVVSPDSVFVGSLLYQYVLRDYYGHRHVAYYAYPMRADGNKVVCIMTRSDGQPPYGPRELSVMEEVCRAFAAELSGLGDKAHKSRPSTAAEHTVEIDASLRPTAPMSLLMQAMLARFYGRPPDTADRARTLPAALLADVARWRESYLHTIEAREDGFVHAFTKSYRGRILCLTAQSLPGGRLRLTLHEDISQHDRIIRMMEACRALPRDRIFILSACLVIAEGVRNPQEIARRAGFPNYNVASAARLISRARSIVDAVA